MEGWEQYLVDDDRPAADLSHGVRAEAPTGGGSCADVAEAQEARAGVGKARGPRADAAEAHESRPRQIAPGSCADVAEALESRADVAEALESRADVGEVDGGALGDEGEETAAGLGDGAEVASHVRDGCLFDLFLATFWGMPTANAEG